MFKQVLVPVLTNYPLRQATMYLVYVSRKHVPLKIRSFIDFLVASTALTPEPEIAVAP
jgi:DNA-binding transcriptional LysR family regulator